MSVGIAMGACSGDHATGVLDYETDLNAAVTPPTVHAANANGGVALTATLDVPDDHDGSPFTADLTLSAPIVDSYRHVRDSAFTVTGGSITGARRVNPQTQSGTTIASQWELTVEPTGGNDDVVLSAPGGRSCDEQGALCTLGGRSLSHALAATVGASPLTATLAAPSDHDGSAFTVGLELSAPIVDSYRHVRDDAFTVTGGSITGARRVNPQTQSGTRVASQWELTVEPAGASDDVVISAPGGRSCDGRGALCTITGQSLSHALDATISRQQDTSSLSVADAEATEGDDATLDFVVTLAPAAAGSVTVDYATSDGTATAGADYTATRGTLTFTAGETTKTVAVPITDDVLADNGETVNFALSNASGAHLGDSVAVGTIRNSEVPGPVRDLSVKPGPNGAHNYQIRWRWPAERHGRRITSYQILLRGCGNGERYLVKVVGGDGQNFFEYASGRSGGGSTFGVRAVNAEGPGECVSKKATPWVSLTTTIVAADFTVGGSTANGYLQGSGGGNSRLGGTSFRVDGTGTSYTVTKLYRVNSDSTVVFATSPALPKDIADHLALTTQTTDPGFIATLCLSDATKSGGDYTWSGTTISSWGTHVSVMTSHRLNGLTATTTGPDRCD